MKGHYVLINPNQEVLHEIHIQNKILSHLKMDSICFDRDYQMKQQFAQFHYSIYQLKEELLPGDTLNMYFTLNYNIIGFEAQPNDYEL